MSEQLLREVFLSAAGVIFRRLDCDREAYLLAWNSPERYLSFVVIFERLTGESWTAIDPLFEIGGPGDD